MEMPMASDDARKGMNGTHRGVIGNCARAVTAECGLKEPLECKIHHEAAMRQKVEASWKTAESRSR